MTKVSDGFVVAGDHLAFDSSLFPPSGVLFKASLQGDSLWMKHYIPLNWEGDRIAWVNFNDVKTTPEGNLVVAGSIADREVQIVRPWILHLDSDGCLVPNCNTVGTKNDEEKANKQFILYPNPVNHELYLLSSISLNEVIEINIINNNGTILKSTTILPQLGYQYILPLSELSPGTYHLIFCRDNKGILESHSFVKQ